MAMPVSIYGDTVGQLGQHILQAAAQDELARARRTELSNALLSQINQTRLGNRQIDRAERGDNLQAALAIAQMENQRQIRQADFANALAAEMRRNAARMAELDRQIQGDKDVAEIQTKRYALTDPRLAIEQSRQAADLEELNRRALAAAANANQLKTVAELKRNQKKNQTKGKHTGLFGTGIFKDTNAIAAEEMEADVKFQDELARIPIMLGEDASLIQFDSARGQYVPVILGNPSPSGRLGIDPSGTGPGAGAVASSGTGSLGAILADQLRRGGTPAAPAPQVPGFMAPTAPVAPPPTPVFSENPNDIKAIQLHALTQAVKSGRISRQEAILRRAEINRRYP